MKAKTTAFRLPKQSGFSLIEVLVGIGVFGISLGGYMTVISNNAKTVRSAEMNQEVSLMRSYIRSTMSCGKTFPAASCNGSPIQVLDSDGNTLVSSPYSDVDERYRLTASCIPDGSEQNRLMFKYTKLGAKDGQAGMDPLTNRRVVDRDLFNDVPVVCPATPPPTAGGPTVGPGCQSIQQKYVGAPDKKACDSKDRTCGLHSDQLRKMVAATTPNAYELILKGDAVKWKFHVSSTFVSYRGPAIEIDHVGTKQPDTLPDITVDAASFLKTPGEFVIPFTSVFSVPADKWYNRRIFITATALDATGREIGDECLHTTQSTSPIVLELGGQDSLRTLESFESNIRFDLDGDGKKENTGWIMSANGNAAFLARDLNGNGKIDDGRELFGDATPMPAGTLAANGYEALGQYDLDHNSMIDTADPIFRELLVWTDRNMDGQSQPSELTSLEKRGITRIAVNFESNTKGTFSKSPAHHNYAPVKSKFWGPSECGANGCATYDIYFGTSLSEIVRR